MIPVLINDIPVSCINHAAVTYNVPATVILSVLKQENGHNGQAVKNKNGTFDLGVMQINSRWLPTFARYGYSRHDLQFDPCKNIMAGTWILASSIANGNSIWSGIGDYHSHTVKYNTAYRNDIHKHYQNILAILNS